MPPLFFFPSPLGASKNCFLFQLQTELITKSVQDLFRNNWLHVCDNLFAPRNEKHAAKEYRFLYTHSFALNFIMAQISIKPLTDVCHYSQVMRYAAFTHKTGLCCSCSSKPSCSSNTNSLVTDKDLCSDRGFPTGPSP